jgi:transcription-repair coupling factor (superfamily II helicase)
LRIAAIKQLAAGLGIEKIDAADKGGYVVFGAHSRIDPVALVQLVQNGTQAYKLQGSHRLQFRGNYEVLAQRFEAVENLLERLRIRD